MKLLLALLLCLMVGHAQAQSSFWTSSAPNANNAQATSVTCGSTSTALGVSGNAYLSIQIPPTATQNVCFAWGVGATATLNPPSQCFSAGTTFYWGGGTGACIVASGSQAITVETNIK